MAAAVHGSALPEVYCPEPECSPPPYPSYERQVPHEFRYLVSQSEEDATEEPPEYNLYDLEQGSFIDRALAQYAQSIGPLASTRYSILEQDEDAPSSGPQAPSRLRDLFLYCIAMFCGTVWAVFWVAAIGYAIIISFQKLFERLG